MEKIFTRNNLKWFLKKTPRYIVVSAESERVLEARVKTALEVGWEISGSLSISHGKTSGFENGFKKDCIHYAQAMIKI